MAPKMLQNAFEAVLFLTFLSLSEAAPAASSTSTSASPTSTALTVGLYSYYGCQTEGSASRALTSKSTAYDGMTLESCASDCAGYKFFGTEYGRECYCGESFSTGSIVAPESDCSFPCGGSSLEVCGAGNRLSSFELTSDFTPGSGSSVPSASSTPTAPAIGLYAYYGCMTEGTNARALAANMDASDGMSLEMCAEFCSGYTYWGTEYARECYCGNTFSTGSVSAVESDCSFECMGDVSEICGAGNRLSVYSLIVSGISASGSSSTSISAAPSSTVPSIGPSIGPSTVSQSTSFSSSSATPSSSVSSTKSSSSSSVNPTSSTSSKSSSSSSSVKSTSSTSKKSTSTTSVKSTSLTSTKSSSSSVKTSTSTKPTSSSSVKNTSASTKSTSSSSSKSSSSTKLSSSSSKSSTLSTSTKSVSSSSSQSSPAISSTSSGTTLATSTTLSISISSTSTVPLTSSSGTTTSSGTTLATSTTLSSSISSTSTFPLTSSSGTTTSAPSVPSATALGLVQTVGAYTFQGCYTEATNARALSGASFYDYLDMSLEECASDCASWKYFGVEYGGECYCGNSLNDGSVLDDISNCGFICPGNDFEYCGAGGHLEMYMNAAWTSATPQTTPVAGAPASSGTSGPLAAINGWNYQGCVADVPDKRTFTFQEANNGAQTIESCISDCNGLGYLIAGLEFGQQCFCSQQLHNGVTPQSNSNCNTECAGNAAEMCGGPNYISVYSVDPPDVLPLAVPQTTGLPGNWTYQGCLEDNINGQRTLPEQLNLDVNDAVNCIDGCQALNYTVAGMEYANQCFCGSPEDVAASGPVFQLEKECSAVCSGNSLYLCGASALLTYYTSS